MSPVLEYATLALIFAVLALTYFLKPLKAAVVVCCTFLFLSILFVLNGEYWLSGFASAMFLATLALFRWRKKTLKEWKTQETPEPHD